MNIKSTLLSAKTITYCQNQDILCADGVPVGSASDLTREIMLARLTFGEIGISKSKI
jgi:hypothetical protein